MKLGDIIRLQVNPVTGYEIDPDELVPNGKWVEVSDGEYEQRGLVKDIIGTSIRMRQLLPSKYRVNVLANTDGWGSGVIEGTTVGSGEYYLGEIVTIGAIANHGFEFTHWQDGETETPREVRVAGDMDFIANFRHKKLTYTVQVVIKPGQELFGTVSGGGTGLQYGERIHISAIPHDGYAFAGWTDGYTQRERDVTVTGDQTYIAQFTPKRHNITVKPDDPTKGYTEGGGVFDHGEITHISAVVTDPACIFDRWSDGFQTPERDIEVLEDAVYIARFTDIPQTEVRIYVLSENDIKGYTDPSGSVICRIGDELIIGAFARTGYQFKAWDDGNEQSVRTIPVTGNATYTALFKPKTTQYYTLEILCDPEEGGWVNSEGGAVTEFPEGTVLHIEAIPNDGYEFDEWELNGEPYSANRGITITLDGDKTLTAKFNELPELPKYTISTICAEGEGETFGDGEYEQGSPCKVIARAADGHHFVGWTEDGVVISTSEGYDFTVECDRVLTAEFEMNADETHNVSIVIVTNDNPSDYAGGVATGGGQYLDGSTCTIHARCADNTYEFVGWTFDDINGELIKPMDYQFTVTHDTVIYAKFRTYVTPTFDVVTGTSPAGLANTTGDGTYNKDTLVTVEIDISSIASQYEFIGWEINGVFYEASSEEDNTYTFAVVRNTEAIAILKLREVTEYAITTDVNPDDCGYVNGGGTYNAGITCELTAVPADGYQFVNWTENGEVVHDSYIYSFTVNRNRTLVVNFEQISYTINASARPDNYGTVEGADTYMYGETCTLKANANSGYKFINWTENGVEVSIEPIYSFEVRGNRSLIANFTGSAPSDYVISASANPRSGGTIEGAGTYTYGQTCTLIATPAEGYEFDCWEENDTEIVGGATLEFTVTSNRSLTAKFIQSTPTSYTVNATANPAGGGSVSGGDEYAPDTTCTLTATANNGYRFVSWKENGVVQSTNPTYSFTVTGNRSLVANFEQLSYTINANARPDGYGTVEGADTYTYGETCTLKANANSGYKFDNWTEDGVEVSTNPTYQFTVTENRSLIANFTGSTPSDYTISATANPRNGGTITGAGTYTYGQTCTLIATPAEGYEFDCWEENDTEIVGGVTLEFTVTCNRSLTTKFIQATPQFTITTEADPSEGGSTSGDNTYDSGTRATVVATPASGYDFVNWTVNDVPVSTETSYTFEVTRTQTVVAHFTKQATPQFTITTEADPSEGGSTSGDNTYDSGTRATVVATPASGYDFVNWTVNGVEVSTDASYTFEVTRTQTVVAHFTKDDPTNDDPTNGETGRD